MRRPRSAAVVVAPRPAGDTTVGVHAELCTHRMGLSAQGPGQCRIEDQGIRSRRLRKRAVGEVEGLGEERRSTTPTVRDGCGVRPGRRSGLGRAGPEHCTEPRGTHRPRPQQDRQEPQQADQDADSIPEKKDQVGHRLARGPAGGRPLAFDRAAYMRRNEVERLINRLKGLRAVATRYDKRAYVFHATVIVAAIRLWAPRLTRRGRQSFGSRSATVGECRSSSQKR
jgi:hypothetical protein